MTDAAWFARYNAAKGRAQYPAAQPPPPAPQQAYYQPQPPPPPQQYYPAQPQPQFAPVPGAPPHAPFGYDPSTGVPIAPYGHDQYGRIMVQPPQAYYPPQPPPPGGYDPRGQVQPQGYGQPPYFAAQPGYDPTSQATFVGEDGQTHVDWSKAPTMYQGGKGTQSSSPCPACHKGFIVPTNASAETRVLNTRTGEFVYPASHCSQCGYSESGGRPGESTEGLVSGISGIRQGAPRMAPGAGTISQVQNQSGMGNLFAPRPAA